jgi:hypothetical protein
MIIKGGLFLGGEPVGRKKDVTEISIYIYISIWNTHYIYPFPYSYIYIYIIEDSIMKPTKNCQKGGEGGNGIKKELR